ncbi:MAG: hypothetical protein CMH55_02260 [Myxococcales bacterium]|nr:hypothetical protein [Myxococcales bacterium]
MSRLRRRPLLVGSAVLFAALSCTPSPWGFTDAGVPVQQDAALVDGGQASDTGSVPDANDPPAQDAGEAPLTDTGAPAPIDSGPAPAPDGGQEPAEDAGARPVQAGDPCDYPNEAICDEHNRPLLICQGRSFQPPWDPEFCSDCEEDANGKMVSHCAVPGFVGIDRAGRFRGSAPALRRLS